MAKIYITKSNVIIQVNEEQLDRINEKRRKIVFVSKPYMETLSKEDPLHFEKWVTSRPKEVYLKSEADLYDHCLEKVKKPATIDED